ncbi:hypothetical protein AVEN_45299-1 [Araneus ventricosus]|uniref:Uncharacterized protein n=1 Tax=Araneus ventricosus TaxID=182803 RepID=A0A4Y2R5P3_ARAVE|nr:hypothetical protein AVEN_45299-1 [Araneus ventricosus]
MVICAVKRDLLIWKVTGEDYFPQSDDEDNILIRRSLPPNFRTTPAVGRLTNSVRFNVHQTHIHSESSNLEPSSPEAETLPLGHCGPKSSLELISKETNIYLS